MRFVADRMPGESAGVPATARRSSAASLPREHVLAIRNEANRLWRGKPPVTGPNIQEIWTALGGQPQLFGVPADTWEAYVNADRADHSLLPGGVVPVGLEQLTRRLTPRTFYGRKVASMLLAIYRYDNGLLTSDDERTA